MRIAVVIFVTSVLAAGAGCRKQDIRTVNIRVPRATGDVCRELVSNSVVRLDGVMSESIRFEEGAVLVTYDSMKIARKNIEYAIAGAGFDANDIPAKPEAREALPVECK